MKREYVKPVIESEEFVANEYVAACWDLKCNTPFCKYNDYNNRIGGDKYTENDFEKCVEDFNKAQIIHKGGDHVYETSSKYYHIGGIGHHELTCILVTSTDEHPNASA